MLRSRRPRIEILLVVTEFSCNEIWVFAAASPSSWVGIPAPGDTV